MLGLSRFVCWERSQKEDDVEKAKKDITDKGRFLRHRGDRS